MLERKRPATYQDVLDAPEHKVAELLDGELFLSPRPGGPHTATASLLGAELIAPFRHGRGGPGGWIILDEPELHLGDQVTVPDLAGWRRTRMAVVPDDHRFTIAPDWICEVASTSTEKLDRYKKLPIYAAAGIGHAWLIAPRRQTLEVLRLHDGKWLQIAVHADGERVRAEPFEAFELDLSILWADLPIRASEPAGTYEEHPW
ncbi:MAG: Uma2 family endonuclease [Deltaproteobacteria bacterium]|nr:Uma2 family endonuclease [Deltaproteobacteria bacterium]